MIPFIVACVAGGFIGFTRMQVSEEAVRMSGAARFY